MTTFNATIGGPFTVGVNPYQTAVADLDGDGHLDLLVVNAGSNDVSVLFGNGHGAFTAAASTITVGTTPRDIVTGDIDGDGDVDFVTANAGSNNVSVFLNDGRGHFTQAAGSPVAAGLNDRALALGDLNGDGKLDIVTANASINTLAVLLGDGAGGFIAAPGSPIATGSVPFDLTLGDFNGDHVLDIAVTNAGSNTVSILLNNGHGQFTNAAGSPVAVGSIPRGVASGDLDGDGDTDLAVVNSSNNNVSILLNDGHGAFTNATGSPVATGGSVPFAVKLADVDGDHDLDMLVTNASSNTVSVLINDGHASFTSDIGSPFATGGNSPRDVTTGDFDEDGDLDMVVSNTNSSTVTTLTNTTATQTTGTTGDDSFTAAGAIQSIFGLSGTDTVTFNFRLVDATITFEGNKIIVDGPTGTHTILSGIERFIFTDGTVDDRDGSPLIDDLFYYSKYHDVWNAHVDADAHFNAFGFKEGRDPSAFFDTKGYLAKYADVAAAGVNPLMHYDQFGFREGRDPSKQFDTALYLSHNADVAAAHVDPLAHFLENGREEGRLPFNDGAFH
jgi:hypothetical protein